MGDAGHVADIVKGLIPVVHGDCEDGLHLRVLDGRTVILVALEIRVARVRVPVPA
jgi:hypothetical protein